MCYSVIITWNVENSYYFMLKYLWVHALSYQIMTSVFVFAKHYDSLFNNLKSTHSKHAIWLNHSHLLTNG